MIWIRIIITSNIQVPRELFDVCNKVNKRANANHKSAGEKNKALVVTVAYNLKKSS